MRNTSEIIHLILPCTEQDNYVYTFTILKRGILPEFDETSPVSELYSRIPTLLGRGFSQTYAFNSVQTAAETTCMQTYQYGVMHGNDDRQKGLISS